MAKPRHAAAPALIEFVLRHMRIQTLPGSLQRCSNGSFTCQRRTLSDTNLIYVLRGKVAWYVDQQEHLLTDRMLMLSPRLVPHHAESRSGRILLLSMHLIPTLPGGQDVFDVLRPRHIQKIQPGARLESYLQAAALEYERDDRHAVEQALHDWAGLITRELFRHSAASNALAVKPFDPVVLRVLERLEARLCLPTRLGDLADLSGYTPQHLNRLFQRALGMTPLRHLAHLRMRRAAQLLDDHRLSVAAVGREVGIDDPYYFSRLFKQHFGKSPLAYRAEADS